MAAEWLFYRQQPTDPISNPISGEFFSTEAVGNVAEALVREGFQNTLDAQKKQPDGSRRILRRGWSPPWMPGANGRESDI